MIFGRVALAAAKGGILAHNLQVADRVLRKGALIDATAYELLAAAGYGEVTIARLEPGDVPEGEAAARLGQLLLAPGLRRSADVHGRVNLFAEAAGLLRLDAAAIARCNSIDESVTLATLPDRSAVKTGDLVATLKIIPFAVAAVVMDAAQAMLEVPPIALKRFGALQVGLILTTLPQLKPATIANTIKATRLRVTTRGGQLLAPIQVPHAAAPLAGAITTMLAAAADLLPDLLLISGASAVTDRQDVAPAAVVQAGGVIEHFGMPVDPGNLICFGRIGEMPAIILPGCARSAKPNGIDLVLDRLFAGETVDAAAVAAMGAGGLLSETQARPAPRAAVDAPGFGAAPRALAPVAAIVLAAGTSSRMGGANKLLTVMADGRPMIAHTVDHAVACGARPVLVITGHQQSEIEAALAGRPVRFIQAPDYAKGLAASLRAGIAALATGIGAALICLGDMPLVEPALLRRLIAAYDPAEGREIILPSFDGQRGNPVLWGSRMFPALLALRGDAGGRQILHRFMEFVAEVPADSDAVLRDFDTPAALQEL